LDGGVRELTLLLDGGRFFEGARWRDGRWYVSDFYANRVIAVGEDGRAETVLEIEQPSGLGWLPDGSLLAVSMTGHKLWRRGDGGRPVLHADTAGFTRGEANDMLVDAAGRAYVTNSGFDLMAGEAPRPADLVRVDPDGSVSVAAGGLHFPNAVMLTGDGATMIVAETIAARLTAFDVAADGTLSGGRVWAQIAPTPPLTALDEVIGAVRFAPDGCTLDAEGCGWAADSLHQRCARIAPGGEIIEEIGVPDDDLVFYGAMLGGADGRTLLTCLAPDWRQARPEDERASALYTARVDAPHAGLP
jgi:sugar lactone lactonase YvrE